MKTCEHCRWWAAGAGRYGSSRNNGQCRVRAPVIKQLADDAGRLVDDRGYWPVTGKDEFCSEFMKRAD
jgi:hypothetical protein